MGESLRTLLVEDSEDDALLVERALRKGGYAVHAQRVETAEAMCKALAAGTFDIVLSDYDLPRFSGLAALKCLRESGADLPFILVSGKIGEEAAAEVMRLGASDYVAKTNLARLVPVVEREMRDVQARRRVRAAEARYAALFESAEIGLWDLDITALRARLAALRDAGVTDPGAHLDAHPDLSAELPRLITVNDVNPAAIRMLGGSSREQLLALLPALFAPDAFRGQRDLLDALWQGAGRFQAEVQHRTLDGRLIDVLLGMPIPADDEAAHHVPVSLTDITRRKRLEAELRSLNANLERRIVEALRENREKDHILIQQSRLAAMGEMIHNIAHQWRQPLNALAIVLSNIKDDFDFNELTGEKLTEAIAQSRRLLEKMSTTIDDFRDFFRPDREASEFDVATAVEQALFVMDASLRNRGVTVEQTLPSGITAFGHGNQFAQAVLNVLANAKEAIQQRDVAEGRIEIELTRAGDVAELTIRDNGGGIGADALARIFEPYFTTKSQGSGIGLYMTKMIVERNLHGTIAATNADHGAAITIRLPIWKEK